MAVEYRIATDEAQKRLIACLRSQLSTELSAILTLQGYSSLPLAAPVDYWTAFNPENVEEMAQGAGKVACFVYQVDEMETETYITGSPDDLYSLSATEFGVSIVFLTDMYEPFTYAGKTITSQEVMLLRGQMYNGAVAECLLKHASDCDEIERIEPGERMPPEIRELESGAVVGFTDHTFIVTQHVSIPAPVVGGI